MSFASTILLRYSLLRAAVLLTAIFPAAGQPVLVTLRLDQSQVAVEEVTTLHVFAQVAPVAQLQADRIFTWYVDLLNLNPTIAACEYNALQRPASDKDPQTSSTGTNDFGNRLGIYDTFVNLAAAGRDTPVELLSVPVKALAPGRTTLRIRAGTTVPLLSADFLVALKNGEEPLTGGDYSAATIELVVKEAGAEPCLPILGVELSTSVPGGRVLTIRFAPCPGQNQAVEYTDSLTGTWQSLPGAPHNSGLVTDGTSTIRRFYRLRVAPVNPYCPKTQSDRKMSSFLAQPIRI